MAKIRPDIGFDKFDPKNPTKNNPISYVGFKASFTFEEVGAFFKKVGSFLKKKPKE